MNYREARGCIDEANRFGHEMGLGAVTALLEEMGNPQQTLACIHIAGTNGKGSVGAHMASALAKAGYRVGRFVSPTLYGYRERIQINENWISEEDFAACMEVTWAAVQRVLAAGKSCPSPFEIETALSFYYYKEKKCDFVILECGMGGATDATNVVSRTLLAVITSISLDHMEYLGDTLEEIAENKAGILKPGAVLVTGRQEPVVAHTLARISGERGNRLVTACPGEARVLASDMDGQRFVYRGFEAAIRLAGEHQVDNAVLSIEALWELRRLGYTMTDEQIRAGMAATVWKGRLTRLRREPDFIVDGAHNPDAAQRLKDALEKYYAGQKPVFLMGIYRDKQVDEICRIMAPMAKEIYTIETPGDMRALPAGELADRAALYNPAVYACGSLEEGVQKSCAAAGAKGVVAAFGSLSFIGPLTRIVEKTR